MPTAVKNTAKGPRGLFNKAGVMVMIDPGQSVSDDFASGDVSDFKKMLKAEGAAAAPQAAEDDEADDKKADANDPANYSVAKLAEHVATIDDVEQLKAMGAAEAKGGDRDGAKKAIQARIDELSKPQE